MRIKLTIPKSLEDKLTGILCLKCHKLVSISAIATAPRAMKRHVDECMGYYRKEAEAEKQRIDREFGGIATLS